jgi:hypothetical protein
MRETRYPVVQGPCSGDMHGTTTSAGSLDEQCWPVPKVPLAHDFTQAWTSPRSRGLGQ